MSLHAAVDLGASSGRVMLGDVGPGHLRLTEAARFANHAVEVPTGLTRGRSAPAGSTLHWDILALWRHALTGLARAAELARESGQPVVSVGVDTWAVDYGLLDATGALIANPTSYRDARTDGVAERLHADYAPQQLYLRNGLQHLPFTTMFQLVAEADSGRLDQAATVLLLPDLIGYWLSGHRGAEATNVSTTGLANVHTGRWSDELIDVTGIDPALLPPVHDSGTVLGPLRPAIAARTGLAGTVVTAVGSHDTASAVVAVPAADEHFAYIACGTWALVGVELESPILTPASLAAGFTNERGVDGRIRYLHNVMGLWVLQGCLADWDPTGADSGALPRLLAAAATLPAGGPVVDIDDPVFLPPGPMATRVQAMCLAADLSVPTDPPAIVRCVLDSLADAFARAVDDAVRLSGRDVSVVHLVGGGALNALLCQLTADACGRPVVAGPVEATALGNIAVQARAHGTLRGTLEDVRALVRATADLTRYLPGGSVADARPVLLGGTP